MNHTSKTFLRRTSVFLVPALCAASVFVQACATAPKQAAPIPANFVRVPAGTFLMGSDNGRDNEKPVHQVTISKPFYIGMHEVTQKEWYDVMKTTISRQQSAAGGSSLFGIGDNYPMYYVSWDEAVEYCNKRSVKEGLTPAYRKSGGTIVCNFNADGYRLPTEAEWEWAAKGGGTDLMVTEYAGSNSPDGVAWYDGNSGSRTHEVGTKAANSLGIYDMSGNVWEWCWDWYGDYPSSAQTDPLGAASGSYRVDRGGSWVYIASLVRSAFRNYNTPPDRYNNVGFRVVRP